MKSVVETKCTYVYVQIVVQDGPYHAEIFSPILIVVQFYEDTQSLPFVTYLGSLSSS